MNRIINLADAETNSLENGEYFTTVITDIRPISDTQSPDGSGKDATDDGEN